MWSPIWQSKLLQYCRTRTILLNCMNESTGSLRSGAGGGHSSYTFCGNRKVSFKKNILCAVADICGNALIILRKEIQTWIPRPFYCQHGVLVIFYLQGLFFL